MLSARRTSQGQTGALIVFIAPQAASGEFTKNKHLNESLTITGYSGPRPHLRPCPISEKVVLLDYRGSDNKQRQEGCRAV